MSRQLIKNVFFSIAIALSLSSCSVFYPRVVSTDLLLLPMQTQSADPVVQKKAVTFIHKGKSQTFIMVSRQTETLLSTTVLLPTGQRILTMRYDGKEFQSSNLTDIALPTKEIFSIMQFATWPEKIIRETYNPSSGWQVFISSTHRELQQDAETILEMSKQNKYLHIAHKVHQYEIVIEPLQDNQ